MAIFRKKHLIKKGERVKVDGIRRSMVDAAV